MTKLKEQRVGVLVDIQNLYYSAKAIHGKKVNFGKVLEEAIAGRKFIRAIAYGIRTIEGQEEKFFDALEIISPLQADVPCTFSILLPHRLILLYFSIKCF